MGTGYTRNDTSNNIADGNIINASDLDGEFNAIESAMGTSGHTHDGTSAEGGAVTVIGPVQDFIASGTAFTAKGTGYDLGSTGTEFEDLFLTGKAYIDGFGESTLFDTTSKIQFRDSALFINSSADGQLDLEADTTIELTAPTVALTNDLSLQSDGAILNFGANDEITVTHVHNTGLNSKSANGFVLGLQTSHTSIVENDVLGKIEFSSPNQTGGGDGALVGASIEAVAEDTFSTTVNSSALVFKTNTEDAAIERMRLTSAGNLHFLDNRKAIFGAGSDLQIYHDGSDSYIKDAGTGNIVIGADAFTYIGNPGGSTTAARFNASGAQIFNHNNDQKLATTSTGVDITGTLTSDGLTVDGDGLFDSDTAKVTVKSFQPKLILDDDSAVGAGSDKLIIQSASSQSAGDYEFVLNNDQTSSADQTAIKISGNGDISFYEDQGSSVKFFWDASEERLGIGTDSPDSPLTIQPAAQGIGTNNVQNWMYSLTSGSEYDLKLKQVVSSGLVKYAFDLRNNGTSYANNLVLDRGNVGIGVTSPSWEASNKALSIGAAANFSGSTNTSLANVIANAYYDSVNSRWEYQNSDHATRYYQLDGAHVWQRAASGTANDALTWSEYMRINGSGQLILGGSTEVGTQSSGRITLIDDSTPIINFYRNDTSISGNNVLGRMSAWTNDSTSNTPLEVARIEMAADGAFGANDNPTRIAFSTTHDGSETMRQVARFDNGGNFIMSSTSGTGNGTIYTETEGTNNLRMGLDAGDAIASGGSYNTFLGDRAGSAQTTGDANTAVGYQALKDEDTHNGNTAIGYDTLRVQNVGANGNNTAVGFNSGVALSTGNNNAFFGAYSASGATVTGAHNVGIGNESLYSLTSGQSNVAVGYQAAQTIKSGQYNVAMGREALELEDDGDGSVAIGYHALRNQNAGDGLIYNTAVGYGAGASITTGIYNTAIGGLAGDASNTGSRNTSLGYAALSNDEKGSFNTAIGYGALSVQDFDVSTNVYNTAVGYLAGNLITRGARNTIVGGLALDHEQGGGRSVAVGYGALTTARHTSETNVYNTAMGYEAGASITDGKNNTLIGGLAGDSMQGPDFNTAVGYNALSAACSGSNVAIGRSAGQAVTGSGNTFVGTEAGELCVATNNNTILGRFSGNEGGLNISTTSNNIVLSDGDGSVAFLKRPNTGEITSGVTNHLAGAVGITSGSTASGDSKYMMAATTDNSANTSVDFVITTGGSSEWQPIGIRVLVSTSNTDAAGTATAEYLFCARTLNSDIGGISQVSAVGNTGSFTMTVSDQNSATTNRAHFRVAVADAKNRTTMYVEAISYGNLLHAART